MTATTYEHAATLAQPRSEVKGNLLFSLYAIIPILLLVVLYDAVFMNNQLRDHWLPTRPTSLVFWAVIFNFPHIASSLITLIDKEYLQYYGPRLIKGGLVITAVVLTVNIAAPLVLSPMQAGAVFIGFFLFYSVYTMHHVLSQQYGLGNMMMRAPRDRLFETWRLLSIAAAALMYIIIFSFNALSNVSARGVNGEQLAFYITTLCVIGSVVTGMLHLRRSKSKMGSYYLLANVAMVASIYLFLYLDYPIFVIMIPRFVHDLTAFMIYSVHDQNRNQNVHHNLIYRALRFIPLSPILLCFPLALVIGNSIECGVYMIDVGLGFTQSSSTECFIREFYAPTENNGLPENMNVWLQILFITTMFHYYIEGFVWRRESIHRHSVKFSL